MHDRDKDKHNWKTERRWCYLMGIISTIKGWVNMLFKNKAKEEFKVESVVSCEMETLLNRCSRIYKGVPDWLDGDDHIKTINFAKVVCSEIARLTVLGIGIKLDGSSRAKWLQQQIDKEYFNIRKWVEYAGAYGTIVLKPNGKGIDLFIPNVDCMITSQQDGEITGIVFSYTEQFGEHKWFTRLEYHRFLDDENYAITNRCYISSKAYGTDKNVEIAKTPWKELKEDVTIGTDNGGIRGYLFGVMKMPHANNVDIGSSLALPIFSDVLEELKDLDIAYSRNSKEVYDSRRTVLLDSDRLLPSGTKISNTLSGFERAKKNMKLPDYVKSVYGDGKDGFYQEINPELRTDDRLKGINALLSQIGFKAGFSNGYFVFNEKTGMITATQVESDDRRTIELIKDVRDQLECCLDDLIYAMNVFADLYGLSPIGTYDVVYSFGDITYNFDEDKKTWYSYVVQGKIRFWRYLVKFEGFTEEEAKQIEEEAIEKEPMLFGNEE